MPYYEDLTDYSYRPAGRAIRALNVGWLDSARSFQKGAVPDGFLPHLWAYCDFAALLTFGIQACSFCPCSDSGATIVTFDGKTLKLGSAEIRVFAPSGAVYAAPNLIFHYVAKHQYQPPKEFISAVLEGVRPGSKEYEDLFRKNVVGPIIRFSAFKGEDVIPHVCE